MVGDTLKIEAIPAFEDNYIWLLSRGGDSGCMVVDPGDEGPVQDILASRGLRLSAILVTHHHFDHTGGIQGLKSAWPEAVVYGPKQESIKTVERPVQQGDRIAVPDSGLTFEVLDVPGHTAGHVAYYTAGALFCGDTLFAGGCGRVFSGTFAQLSQSLQKLAALPGDTQVYCAHEYTQDNLGFAQWVEPDNPALLHRIQQVNAQRSHDLSTVPSTLAEELVTNPFMRTDQTEVIAAAERWSGRTLSNCEEVFQAIRTWKDKEYD
jgi:hydroxyacylglutathione hydrolase